ncbi:MAG TPA: ABC transporter substrate-binding protein [Candidatus Binatia bacterium]|nr:ABC transporter substrate-binding protein [Candidatus Binatia bacterium]
MIKKIMLLALCALLLAPCVPTQAQQPKKTPRIGYIAARSGPGGGEKAFIESLQSLGYIEGQTISIEWRFAHEKLDRLPDLATELVQLRVDAIVTSGGNPTVRAVKNATTTIPIVMAGVSDAVELGFVASLARPGGNITGTSSLAPELSGKLLELTKEAIPKASRVAVLYSASPNWKLYFKQMEAPARSLGVQLLNFQLHGPDELEGTFETIRSKRADAVVIPSSAFLSLYRKQIVALAAQSRLPAIGSNAPWAQEGCLLAYGPISAESSRRAAMYVDKILKGAKPADLPVEQPKKFELVINLKTAKQIGLTIPPNVLARADKVIK